MSAKDQKLEMSKGCSMYDACPICFNCINKAAHLYARCQTCEVPHDGHTERNRAMLIRRDNFAITVTPETGKALVEFVENKKKEIEARERD
ncbi:hypothetical protein D3C85_501470 [compost metagenome]